MNERKNLLLKKHIFNSVPDEIWKCLLYTYQKTRTCNVLKQKTGENDTLTKTLVAKIKQISPSQKKNENFLSPPESSKANIHPDLLKTPNYDSDENENNVPNNEKMEETQNSK